MREQKEFGKALRRLINSPDVFSLLPEGDWGAGGCWELASAVAQFLGPSAELWAIQSTGGLEDLVEHVMVKYDRLYIDSNGTQTKSELEKNIRQDPHYRGRVLRWVKFTGKLQAETERQGYVPNDIRIVKALRSEFEKAFLFSSGK